MRVSAIPRSNVSKSWHNFFCSLQKDILYVWRKCVVNHLDKELLQSSGPLHVLGTELHFMAFKQISTPLLQTNFPDRNNFFRFRHIAISINFGNKTFCYFEKKVHLTSWFNCSQELVFWTTSSFVGGICVKQRQCRYNLQHLARPNEWLRGPLGEINTNFAYGHLKIL